MRNNLVYWVFTVFLACSCNQAVKTDQPAPVVQGSIEKAPRFNADSAYAFIQQQVDFGPRVPNSDAHKACALICKKKCLGLPIKYLYRTLNREINRVNFINSRTLWQALIPGPVGEFYWGRTGIPG